MFEIKTPCVPMAAISTQSAQNNKKQESTTADSVTARRNKNIALSRQTNQGFSQIHNNPCISLTQIANPLFFFFLFCSIAVVFPVKRAICDTRLRKNMSPTRERFN